MFCEIEGTIPNSDSIFLGESVLRPNKNLLLVEEIFKSLSGKDGKIDPSKIIKEVNKINRIEKILASTFNVERFILDIDPIGENAFTYPISPSIQNLFESKDSLKTVVKNNIVQFKEKKSKIMYVCVSSPLASLLSPKELLAIILHEVGHNFYKSGVSSTIISVLFSPIIFLYKKAYEMKGDFVKDLLTFNPVRKTLAFISVKFSETDGIIDKVKEFLNPLLFLAAIPSLIKDLLANTVNAILSLFFKEGYANEKFADNFASMHGYGSALSSALVKLTEKSYMISGKESEKEIPELNRNLNFFQTILIMIVAPFDEHPSVIKRIDNQIKLMEKSISKEKSKKKIEFIRQEISRLKETKEIYKKTLEKAIGENSEIIISSQSALDNVKEFFSKGGGEIEDISKSSSNLALMKNSFIRTFK
jgi:Zn-dependent protease with chaperone function